MQSWKKLLVEGRIKRRRSSPDEIRKMIKRAQTYLTDANLEALSMDTRYQIAYESGRMWCEVVVRAAGFRTTSASGHHEAVISGLPEILGPEVENLAIFLDKSRKIRHAIMYGDELDVTTPNYVKSLIKTVNEIQDNAVAWLKKEYPDLLSK